MSQNQDQEHLKLLSIFHYIVGGLTALFACLPLLYVALGLAFVLAPASFANKPGAQPPPGFLGWFFVGFGAFFFLLGQSLAVSMLVAGRFLSKRKRYTFAFVVACLECLFMPFGTVLGVFTIIVLSRESVKTLFNAGISGPPASPEGLG